MTATRCQTAGETTLKRHFPKVVFTREHDLVLEYRWKTEIPASHWFSKLHDTNGANGALPGSEMEKARHK
jgi:hypothetical protein